MKVQAGRGYSKISFACSHAKRGEEDFFLHCRLRRKKGGRRDQETVTWAAEGLLTSNSAKERAEILP